MLEVTSSDPFSLWRRTDRVILDEVQKEPQLLSAVKRPLTGAGRLCGLCSPVLPICLP
jgi:hypothetical protein